jgi:hypothetical protein
MTYLGLAVVPLLAWVMSAGAAPPPETRHPNLLLNRAEIEQVRAKVKQHAWVARLFERVRELADQPGRTTRNPREAALVYALTGEPRYARAVREALLGNARNLLPKFEQLDIERNPDFGAWGPYTTWAWAYDLTYDTFSAEERQVVERLFRTVARTIIAGLKVRTTDPDLVFGKHFEVGLLGYCLGDPELIAWGLNDPGHHGPAFGGFYQVLDTNVRDRYFWGEAPRYALGRSLQGMLMLAEAALHFDGTDLYHHVSAKSGASIKGLIDGYLRLAYPLEKTGIGGGSLRMANFGDASTTFSPRGELIDTFLINPIRGGPKLELSLNGELELAYKRYRDPGYAWLLRLNPERDAYIDVSKSAGAGKIWGYIALTHGEPLPDDPSPPAAPGGAYPGQGLAVLRADESARYWTSGSLAAVLRLGAAVGHGHKDYFHLMLHGKGRLLYPDLELITYEPTYLNWTHEGIAHNTLLVDQQSPRPGPTTPRQDFAPEAKFFALTGSAFEGVTQTRALVLTPDYLADVFRAADDRRQERCFDWVLHGFGRLYPGNPGAYRPTQALLPSYWWVERERGRTTAHAWRADWVQTSGGLTRGLQPVGPEWFAQTVGVRLTMLGAPDTEVYTGDGPITDGPPHARLDGNPEGTLPLVVARRRAPATTFAAVHEPYTRRPALGRVRMLQETAAAVGLEVAAAAFSDRVLVAFDPAQEQTLRAADGEGFTFRDHGYVRIAGHRVTVRGPVKALRVRVPNTDRVEMVVNGRPQAARHEGEFWVLGDLTPGAAAAAEAPAETRAAVHAAFLPEEAHLRAGGEQAVALHLYCTGTGEAPGRLRLAAPPGITVEPGVIDLRGMSEGARRVVPLRVRAASEAAHTLSTIRAEAEGQGPAPAATLPVAVGVVITEDKRIPLAAESVIRAPGYTMRIDHQSGVCCYLLDAEGHRRHGHVNNSAHSYLGIGAVERDGRWPFRYRTPCRLIFDGKNTLVAVSGSGGEQVRLRYTFHEDHVSLALVPPTNAGHDFALWFGDFDALGEPRHDGKAAPKNVKSAYATAGWFFFPHPVHRQGLLVRAPPKTGLLHSGTAFHVRVRAGQEVELRFAREEELPGLVGEKLSPTPARP